MYGLEIVQMRSRFNVLDPFTLPPFSGSMLRGILGRAMSRVRYGHSPACQACTIRSGCRYGNLYAYLFESPWDHPFILSFHITLPERQQRVTYPQPFILNLPAPGLYRENEELILTLTLIGKATQLTPFFNCSMAQVEQFPLGSQRGRAKIESIDFIPISESGFEQGSDGIPQRIKIRFLTPFRFRANNRLGGTLDFYLFVKNLYRRLVHLSIHNNGDIPIGLQDLWQIASEVKTVQKSLHWFEFERYSNRQKDHMLLGGYIGEIIFEGDIAPFLPLIRIGEAVNIGKQGSFGFGKYKTFMENVQQ